MTGFSRREFLEQALFAGAVAAGGMPALAADPRPRAGANERLRVAVVGVHGQGRVHVGRWVGFADVEVAAICDPDESVVGDAIASVEKKAGNKPVHYKDIRKLLEDKSIDAISIATPNHWHVLAGVWGVQAGKDVYVEKPLGHNYWECAKLVEASRKHGKMVQMGNYPRSLGHVKDAVRFLRENKLGKVKVARGICYNKRDSIGKKKDADPPKGVDYDLWLGPAPEAPFNPNRFHYNWHWNWTFGGGEIANNGIYQLDTARWAIGKDQAPSSVISVGGRVGYEDDGQTPNTEISLFDYGDVRIVQEIRGLPTKKYPPDIMMGNIFHCENGTVVISIAGSAAYAPGGELIQRFSGTGDHFRNFADAVKSRKREDLASEVQEGHRSTALCHLANISYRRGTTLPAADAAKALTGDSGQEAWDRLSAHLHENEIEVGKLAVCAGRPVALDEESGSFKGDAESSALLTRTYRKGFAVPENV